REGHGFIRAVARASAILHPRLISAALAAEATPVDQTGVALRCRRPNLFHYGRHLRSPVTVPNETIAKLSIETLYDYRLQGKYQIHPFVVMPEHFYMIFHSPTRSHAGTC